MSFKSWVTVISEQCQEIKQAIASCPYFATWEADEIAECSRVSFIAVYSPDQIILGPSTGNSHSVFFILEGVCKMVQHLQFEVEKNPNGEKVYKLSSFDSKPSHSKSTNENFSSRLLNEKWNFLTEKFFIKSSVHLEKEQTGVYKDKLSSEVREEGEEKEEVKSTDTLDNHLEEKTVGIDRETEIQNDSQGETSTIEEAPRNLEKELKECQKIEFSTQKVSQVTDLPEEPEPKREINFETNHHLKILEECIQKRKETVLVYRKGSLPEKSKSVKGFFVQTGFLHKGACFGLEKCEKQHFIMSATKVKCLAIPQRFLIKHKPCYIWDKIRLFHSLYLPKDIEILKELRFNRKWIRNKKELSEKIVSLKSIPNYTLINEVPFSMRLENV